jgi:P27 family predicted phage terminase small subunit
MAGRPKKPRKLKQLQGTLNQTRDKQDSGGLALPELSVLPTPPDYLSDLAKEYFMNVCKTLMEYGLLTGADLFLVVQLAQNLSINQEAYQNIKDGQAVQLSPNKYQTVTGWYSVFDKTSKKIMELSNQFGLNPSARAKFNIQQPEKPDELDELLNK